MPISSRDASPANRRWCAAWARVNAGGYRGVPTTVVPDVWLPDPARRADSDYGLAVTQAMRDLHAIGLVRGDMFYTSVAPLGHDYQGRSLAGLSIHDSTTQQLRNVASPKEPSGIRARVAPSAP